MVQRTSKNIFNLPPEIHLMANMEKLGELRKVYPVSKRFTAIWVIGQVFLAWGLMISPIVLVAILISPGPPSLLIAFVVATSTLLLLLVGSYMSFSRRIYARWRVSLWQYGFIYEKGQIRQAFRWHQIEYVQATMTQGNNGPAPIVHSCKVCRQDGYEVKLAAFKDLPELIDVILEESARQLAPQELSIAHPRNTRTFTTLKLDRQGIGNEQETLSWQEIQEFMTKNGTVTLLKKDE